MVRAGLSKTLRMTASLRSIMHPNVVGLPLILSLEAGLRQANRAKRLAVRAKSLYNNVCPVEPDVVPAALRDSIQVNIFNFVDQGEMAELVEGARLEIA